MSLPRNQSSFAPGDYGAAGAAEIQNSFADFEYVTLPSPLAEPFKISRGFGPNFAYSNGAVPILVAFGDSSGRRFLFIPGETLNGLKFRDIYVWAAETSQAGNVALVKWGAQDFRPSVRQLPGNPLTELTTISHVATVGEYGVTPSPEIVAFSGSRVGMEVIPKPVLTLSIDASGTYFFGIGHSALEAESNFERALNESTVFSSIGAGPAFLTSENRPFGYYDSGTNAFSPNAYLSGPGPLYFTHNLAANIFANTPYDLIFRELTNTF